MAIELHPPLSTQPFDVPRVDQSKVGVLNSKALPNGLNAVYLQDKLYKITDKTGSEPRIACAISLLNNLQYESGIELQSLKQDKRLGVIHVQDGEIKSLTLTKDQIQMMRDNGVNEIAFKVNQTLLTIKEKMILREFASAEEYKNFSNLI